MASSPKEKFDAAVKVIRGLPKNGSFQPSHDLMLKFYSYFKQATEGPCSAPKPGFWDLVNRKKWEAWSKLGNMDREEAMLSYVDELKKIVETMPQTEAVTEFLQKLENFYEMVEDSENHNTLKIMDKPKPNGSLRMNGSTENGHDKGENLEHSSNITQFLKQDATWWQDRPSVLSGNNDATTNGNGSYPNFDHSQDARLNGGVGSEREDEEQNEYDDDEEDDDEEKQAAGSTEEWEEVNEAKLGHSQSESAGDSETESEEFCDTSDEPVELTTAASAQILSSRLPALDELPATSTPSGGGKYVHFDPSTPELQMSDSLYVNTSRNASKFSDLASHPRPGEVSLLDPSHDRSYFDDLDISMCRGGEEQERERRRRGGGQGSREWSTSGARGGHGGSGGDGGDNGSGGSGRRGLFPGPGGGGGGRGAGAGGDFAPTDLNEQIVVTLLRLQHDMSGVLNRLNSLEALVKEGKLEKDRKSKAEKRWWPFPDLSMKSALIIFVWPLIVHFVIMYISRRRRKLGR